MQWILAPRIAALAVLLAASPSMAQEPAEGPARLTLRRGDRIVLVGNTLAERQQLFNHFETLLMTRFPELQLAVRNLGWSGDTLTLQPRPLNFGDAAMHLERQRADVILAFFGLNESFEGEPGLAAFESDLERYLQTQTTARYNGTSPPRVVLVSPLAHEALSRPIHVDVDARNRELARYTGTMRRVAARLAVPFVDLYNPTARLMPGPDDLTINGIHVNQAGDRVVAGLLMAGLGFAATGPREPAAGEMKRLEALRELIRTKNEEFFRRWRPLNAEYVVGRRVEPFGSVTFPPEMQELDRRVDQMDRDIWQKARALKGAAYPAAPDGTAAAAAGSRR